MDEKICTDCGKTKPLTEFHKAVAGLAGHMAQCKACRAAYARSQLPPRPALTCLHCGKEFPNPARQGPDRKFCSPQCKGGYWHARRKEQRQALPPRMCRKCGGPVAHKSGLPVCGTCKIDDRSRPYKRDVYMRRVYGITEEEFQALLKRQRGRCAICPAKKPGGAGNWHIDHDHVTGQVRGLLCNNCNLGIGYLQDDPEVIAAAVQYVRKHRQMELFQRKAG